ncbi:FRG domain-containing protein [Aureimonas phyllosphaerae]|uniref:FRG domain-containing protein n=1 Tax=Aureimonas phyllosphaerae TaxID=1166078 RepID=A0A7W6FWC6_9HYPH|nr:FRG domain-containing protein [Aureimonas phyllosphaerae]MBB3938204.1 hypothetical protein [Aureimonas phyllosphaerae]MBB3962214.1 hypothetical protein [Aureimonas phyllosphaerae]SFF58560.1 FRG domain-containing protein [Aureimonas phyllosphaerae]
MPIIEIPLKSTEEVLLAMQFGPTAAQAGRDNAPTWRGDIRRHWVFRGHGDPSWTMQPKAWRADYLQKQEEIRGNIQGVIDRYLPSPLFEFSHDAHMQHFAYFLEYRLSAYFARHASQLGLLETSRWHHNSDPADALAIGGELRKMGDDLGEYLATLSIAQHYDIATRLLDFSFNPMKALSFAIYGMQRDIHQVAVFALNINEMPYVDLKTKNDGNFLEDDNKWSKYIAPYSSNRNIFAQEGLFITMLDPGHHYGINGKFPTLEDAYKRSEDPILYKLVVDGFDLIADVRTMLIRLQCTPADLMPSLDNCAKAAQLRLETIVALEHGPASDLSSGKLGPVDIVGSRMG